MGESAIRAALFGFFYGLGQDGGEICGVKGLEPFQPCRIEQGRRGGDEGNRGAGEHIASSERRAELQSLRPTKRSAVKKLARGFKNARIQGLLHHAGGLDAQKLERGGGGFRRDLAGPFAPPDGRIHFEGTCRRDQFPVVLNGFHETDERIGSRLAHKQTGERRSFKKKEAHWLPRS